jgi:hypothetical protein
MALLESEQTALQSAMGQTTVAADLAQHGKRLKELETLLPQLESRWLELTAQLETVT